MKLKYKIILNLIFPIICGIAIVIMAWIKVYLDSKNIVKYATDKLFKY